MAAKERNRKGQPDAPAGPEPPASTEPTREADAIGRFPIVGIGASAGGLEALRRLLEAMPGEPGMALVVIQHLDPTRKSLAPELLARYAKMQVCEVHDDPRVKPNRIYVIPPAKYLSISAGELHLSGPDQPRGARMAIDFFLRSLSKNDTHGPVAVILSGTGTDGTLGIKAVKTAGGLVIAQDPSTAEHQGMPRSAIATGMVDHILPPDQIPAVLVRYAQHSYTRDAVESPEEGGASVEPAHDGLSAILALLRTHTRHDFRSYKEKTLARRTRRRMCLYHLDEYDQYLHHLRTHPNEIEALARDLLITVTDFFRDREAWDELRRLAIAPLVEAKGSDAPVRVWTPGCATGEEPYSVAMLFLEELRRVEKHCRLQVFASDIDKAALDHARAGRYLRSIEADVSPERLQRFFTAEDGDDYYQVNKPLREAVTFAEQNLIGDPPFSRLDLVCCRNLLIYLKPDVQEKVIALFHFALREGGVLFLGGAETIGRQADLFQTLDKRWRIYRRVGPTRPDRVDIPLTTSAPRHEIDSAPAPVLRRETRLTQLAQQRLLEMLAPAAVLIDRSWRILYISGDVDPYVTRMAGVPSDNLLDNARRGLRAKLRGAVYQALSEKQSVSVTAKVQRDSTYQPVVVTVRVIRDREQEEDLILVMFEEGEGASPRPGAEGATDPPAGAAVAARRADPDVDADTVVRQLEEELARVRDDLQATIEQQEASNEEYKAANEEAMSINEELQSTNEELETSKEELQSLNEELSTVNNQLAAKVEEVETKHADLENLVAVTDVPAVCLDTDLAVRWFTPAAQLVLRLKPADRGRPLADFAHDFTASDLAQVAQRVLSSLTPVEDEAPCHDGRTFVRRVTPYRADAHRIGGVMITLWDITERKRSERMMAEAKEYAEHIIQSLPEPLLVLTPELRVRSANAAFYWHFQVRPDETVGQQVYHLGNGQWNIPALRQLLEDVLPDNKVFDGYLVDHEFKDLGRRVMVLNGRRLDHLHLILLGIQDVTEQHRAEEAVRASEQRLRRMINIDGVGVLLFDASGTMVDANDAFLQMSGYTREEVAGQTLTWRTLTPPEHVATSEHQLQKLKETDHLGPYEKEYLRKDGSRSWMAFAGAGLGDGTVIEYCIDVSDRKRAEEALRRLNEELEQRVAARTQEIRRLATLVESAHDAILIRSLEGTITTWNPGAERLYGYTAEEVIGHGADVLVPPDCRHELNQRIERLLRGEPVEPFETRRLTKSGRTILVSIALSPIREAAGQIVGVASVGRDVTRRNELEREVVEIASLQQRRIGQDLHDSVAQELTALNLLARDLSESASSNPQHAAQLTDRLTQGLQRSQQELRSVLRGLLPVAVDAEGLMAALADLAERTRQDGKTCTFDCPEPIEVTDNLTATHLYLIAQEAVNNAVRHGQPQQIYIALQKVGVDLVLSVQDDGTGIPTQAPEKPGLGLRIMRNRAGIVGATLTVEPAQPTGTVVTCVLARNKHERENRDEEARPGPDRR